jgi:release factor glutamine methyltransferase
MHSQEERWLLEEKYHGEKSEAFFADLIRLKSGEPLAYLIGSIPFLNCQIHLDSKPLIPRPETEYWAEQLIKEIIDKQLTNPKVLDLCAGSGAIGVAVAKAIPTSQVTFIEIEETHLPTIKKNCLHNHLPEPQYKVLAGDLFSVSNEKSLGKYDFIVTNPPYIDPELSSRTEDSVKKHEPALALYGGANGMELIKIIIAEAPEYLSSGGQLWIEHEPEQIEAIHTLSKEKFLSTTCKDQYSVDRFTKLVLQ